MQVHNRSGCWLLLVSSICSGTALVLAQSLLLLAELHSRSCCWLLEATIAPAAGCWQPDVWAGARTCWWCVEAKQLQPGSLLKDPIGRCHHLRSTPAPLRARLHLPRATRWCGGSLLKGPRTLLNFSRKSPQFVPVPFGLCTITRIEAVSYTHLTLPTTPYV